MSALPPDATAWFSQHIVGLEVTYMVRRQQKPHELSKAFYTGFLLHEKQVTFWVTAGHCMEQIDLEILGKPDIYYDVKFRFVDFLHPNAVSDMAVPFPYQQDILKHYHINTNSSNRLIGFDYGVIVLRPHYAKLLMANKIKPIVDVNWINVPEQFGVYCMLGIPDEKTRLTEQGIFSVTPMMFSVTKLDEKPTQYSHYVDPMFFGEIQPDAQVDNIVGMSGGPIIGFTVTDEETARYWILAVQSRWTSGNRQFAASPLSNLREALQLFIDVVLY